MKIQELDAPLYYSDYNLTIKIEYHGENFELGSNFTKNSSRLIGKLDGNKMKLEQKLTVNFNHKIEVPLLSYETI